jgi:thiamine transport system permease protein
MNKRLVMWLPLLVFLGVFYFYPLASIVAVSLERLEEGWPALAAQITAPPVRRALWFTTWQAIISTLLTLAVGLPGAYIVARYSFRGRTVLRALSTVPFVLPTLVVAAAFDALLGPRGIVNDTLVARLNLAEPPIGFSGTIAAILVAHVFYNTAIVLRLVGDFWAQISPHIDDAARVLGASRYQVARHVTLPMLAPAVAAAALLVFIFCFTSFGVILVLGGPRFATLEVEIYAQTVGRFNLPLAAALSMVQLAATLGLTLVYTSLSRRVTRPLELTSFRHSRQRLTGPRQRLTVFLVTGALFGLLLSPLAALAVRSVTPVRAGRDATTASNLTLRYYETLDENPRRSAFYASPLRAVGNSLAVAAVTVALALGLGLPAAYNLASSQESRLNRLIDPILMLPLGTSAVTLGLGFIVALGRPPIDLRASPILLPLAHALVALPFVVRSLTPALRVIQPQLRDAAAVLGAAPIQVVRHIDAPLVGRAVAVGATFAFMISLGEFGATALLARPDSPTLPVVIYRLLGQPGALFYGQAMALSTILMAVTATGMLAIERLRIARVGEF